MLIYKNNVHRIFHLDSSIGISEFRRWKCVTTLKDKICNACMFRVLKHHCSICCRILWWRGVINRPKTEVEVIITVIIMIIIL